MDPDPIDMYPHLDKMHKNRSGLKGLLHKLNPLPLHVYLPLRFELYQAKVRFFAKGAHRKYRGKKGLLVNIGPGPNAKQGWVNLDIAKKGGVNCVYDCRKSLPFEDNSVKGIFMEHCLEHIDYTEEVPHFISEVYRVLEPGGVIRIIVPDMEKYLRAYCEADWEQLKDIRPLNDALEDHWFKCRYRTKMELINMLFRQGFEHKYGYDFETLSFVLKKYGFDEVIHQTYGKSKMPELNLDQEQRASESLYIEAVK